MTSSSVARPALIAPLAVAPIRSVGVAAGRLRRTTVAWTPPRWLLATGSALVLVMAVLSARAVNADSGGDLVSMLATAGADVLRWRWQFAAVVAALAALHYAAAAAAVAARAAAGVRLPMREAVLVQLAASAANRISAAGVGGTAVNARYFSRRGLPIASAVGAIAALGALGAVADLAVLGLLVVVGPWLGLSGAAGEVGVLASAVTGLLGPLLSVWTWSAVLVAAGLLVLTRRRWSARFSSALRHVVRPLRALLAAPGRLCLLLAASGATTLILAIAFVASVDMVPGSSAHAGTAALLVGFMFGAAAGNAVPVPAGIGSTETALVTVLVAGGVPAGHAVQVVIGTGC